jgi:uncharacterized protein YkwD
VPCGAATGDYRSAERRPTKTVAGGKTPLLRHAHMPFRARNLLPALAVITATALTVPTPPAGAAVARSCPGALTIPSVSSLAQSRSATLCLLNHQRAAHGLAELRSNPRLALAADRHSADMVTRGYFAHDTPSGISLLGRIKRLGGYITPGSAWTIGENIAWGSGSFATPATIVDTWMHSPEHRANILDRAYREIGVGIATGAPAETRGLGAATYTTDFGRR